MFRLHFGGFGLFNKRAILNTIRGRGNFVRTLWQKYFSNIIKFTQEPCNDKYSNVMFYYKRESMMTKRHENNDLTLHSGKPTGVTPPTARLQWLSPGCSAPTALVKRKRGKNRSEIVNYLADPGLKLRPLSCQEQIWRGRHRSRRDERVIHSIQFLHISVKSSSYYATHA